MNFEPLLSRFIEVTDATFSRRQTPLNSPQLADDLRLFLEKYQAGEFGWFGDRFVLRPEPFAYNLNIYVSLRDIVPFRGGGDAFRGYNDCYVLFEFIWESSGPDDTTNLRFDIPNVYLGVDLNQENFGWIFLYCPGEFEAQLSSTATYIAKSWSDFMSLVIENRLEFNGHPFWSPPNKVLSDQDLNDCYVPELPKAK